MNSHDATFRDGVWTNPRFRRDPGYWNEPYWTSNFRTARRSWQEWDQDHAEDHGEQDHEEDDDTWREQG